MLTIIFNDLGSTNIKFKFKINIYKLERSRDGNIEKDTFHRFFPLTVITG
jgi:hypothetical protein